MIRASSAACKSILTTNLQHVHKFNTFEHLGIAYKALKPVHTDWREVFQPRLRAAFSAQPDAARWRSTASKFEATSGSFFPGAQPNHASIHNSLAAPAKSFSQLLPQQVAQRGGWRGLYHGSSRRNFWTHAHVVDPQIMKKARWISLPVGLGAGLFGSLVGVGGGVLVVPTIVAACKSIPQRLVSGTSLAVVVSTATVSALTYTKHACIDFVAAGLIAPAAMLTAPLGALATTRIKNEGLKRILGYFLYVVAVLVPLKPLIFTMREAHSSEATGPHGLPEEAGIHPASGAGTGTKGLPVLIPLAARHVASMKVGQASAEGEGWWMRGVERMREEWPGWPAAAALLATGAVAGFASGLLGIGGGTIVTPMLALSTDLPQTTVVGTSLLALLPPSCTGLLQHWRLGNVDWLMAGGLAAGTAFGSLAGSNAAVHAPPGVLEIVFSAGMFLLGHGTFAGPEEGTLTP
eukprot:jgi/Botrbrau1/12933/Bobra.92_1s0013.1